MFMEQRCTTIKIHLYKCLLKQEIYSVEKLCRRCIQKDWLHFHKMPCKVEMQTRHLVKILLTFYAEALSADSSSVAMWDIWRSRAAPSICLLPFEDNIKTQMRRIERSAGQTGTSSSEHTDILSFTERTKSFVSTKTGTDQMQSPVLHAVGSFSNFSLCSTESERINNNK